MSNQSVCQIRDRVRGCVARLGLRHVREGYGVRGGYGARGCGCVVTVKRSTFRAKERLYDSGRFPKSRPVNAKWRTDNKSTQ